MQADNNTLRSTPSSSNACATRWPLFLVHGVAVRRAEKVRYWGRIPDLLRAYGASVHISNQDAWGSFESNAKQLQAELAQVLHTTQADKVNVIAHSKGGVDTRVLATYPEMHERIASITTISSPHKGLKSLNWLTATPELLKRSLTTVIDILLILTGETNPSFAQVSESLSERGMLQFAERYAMPEGIVVQSFSAIRNDHLNDPLFILTGLLLQAIDADNDGVVPVESSNFGEYLGLINSEGPSLSHRQVTDTSFLDILPEKLTRALGREPEVGLLAKQLAERLALQRTAGQRAAGQRAAGREAADKQTAVEQEAAGTSSSTDTALPTKSRKSFDTLGWWVQMVADLKERGL